MEMGGHYMHGRHFLWIGLGVLGSETFFILLVALASRLTILGRHRRMVRRIKL